MFCCIVSCYLFSGCAAPTRVLGLLHQWSWSEVRHKIQARLYWGPCGGAGGVRASNRFPCFLTCWRGGPSCFLIWGEGRGVQGLAGGMAYVACPLLGWLCVQTACTEPCICSQPCSPGSSKLAVGLFVFNLFVSFCPEFALTAHACCYF